MRIFAKTLFIVSLLPILSCAHTLDRQAHDELIKQLKSSPSQGKVVRLITDENFEVPDPTRPLLLNLPGQQQKYVIGFSGQNILVVDSLQQLVSGGLKKTSKVELRNEFGFLYGGEINPATGQPLGYSEDSSTWDISVFRYNKPNGETALRVLAGAMGTGSDGKPLLISDGHNNTRQRLFFDAEFNHQMKLRAAQPKAVLNSGVPVDGNWIQKNSAGKVIFSHGYGGEPVTLLNGDLYVNENGWVPFVYETVVEQREERDPQAPNGVRKIPYRTAIVVSYLDSTLSKVMAPMKIILDVYKPDGSVWKAAQRPTAGPLVEGAHIEIRSNGKPVESMAQMRALRKNKAPIEYQMLFSAGEYFGTYGSFIAVSKNNLESFVAVTDDKGELLDLTAPLRVLFTWIGRPVSFHVDGQEYLMIHGVNRNALPQGFVLDQLPKGHEWPHFKRQEIIVPVQRTMKKGLPVLEMRDDSGLIEKLKKYVPRKVSFTDVLVLRRADLETV